ncbi:sugar ABC transporter ATP-binding protein [Sinorhizobium meliloti]|uniref:sugar ABC transporter ATP-binding protein n=1 Tax=Rhizobium meliloti TaxID=382 RepID=UPI000379666C|nr:sugar ABC transporter ATP-binding protein [Sinorhizobium meliloti]
MTSNPVLDVRNVSKSFWGVQALKGVDFELQRGEIHALCGENGAGKSTLVRIISGLAKPDDGEIHIDGEIQRPGQKTQSHLVSVVYQELSIIPDLTVLENVLLGDPRLKWVFRNARFSDEVRALLDRIGLSDVPLDILARKLTVAEQQLLEICRAVLRRSRVLILDEPTASLSDAEIQRVFETVTWLRNEGTAIIYISHRLPEIFALTDRITVFRNGRRVLTKETSAWDANELVREMIGRDVACTGHHGARADFDAAPVAVELSKLCIPGKIQGFDLKVRKGEIVGLIGQLGSGASDAVEALAGLECRYSGSIIVDYEQVLLTSQKRAVEAGIAYVTEDRGSKSLFQGATVQQNITSANLAALSRKGIVDRHATKASATALAHRFQIDSARLNYDIGALSGGNQQKVAIAKSVAVGPKVLVLNEPTRGVDVGARTEIYRELRSLADLGMAVIFFSTDLEEIKELSDRVVTIFKGKVVSDQRAHTLTTDDILSHILRGNNVQEVAA